MSTPSHLFAGRQGRPGHRKLLAKPSPPSVIETKTKRVSFRGVVCWLIPIGVAVLGWVAWVEWFA